MIFFYININSSEHKDYILTMLFIKYLSDLQKDRLKELKEKYGNNERRIKRALEREKIIIGEDTTFEYLYKHKEVSNLGEIINKVLEKIEEDNREKAIKLALIHNLALRAKWFKWCLIFKVSNLKKANIERTI